MKTYNVLKPLTLGVALFLSSFILSCDDENRLTLQDSQEVAEDALTDSYFEDADDLSGITLQADASTAGGASRQAGTITVNDARICSGATVTIEPSSASTAQNPSGLITIDFGLGCTDLRGNVRSGKLLIAYSGRRFQPGSTVVLTTDNYFINAIKLEGTRTLTNISGSTENSPKFQIELVNGKATFPEGSIATRNASLTREWVRGTSPNEDQLRVEGSANGITRGERNYTMEIQETIVFKRGCGFPVSGVKVFTVEGKAITIDYGDGVCDRSVTYTVGDRTRTTNVGKN